jgi:hypothetical protein
MPHQSASAALPLYTTGGYIKGYIIVGLKLIIHSHLSVPTRSSRISVSAALCAVDTYQGITVLRKTPHQSASALLPLCFNVGLYYSLKFTHM